MSLHLITGYAGKEHVTSADQGSYNAATMGEGQFVLERGNQFAAQIISNNKVRVLDGDMMMQGRHIRLNENTYEEMDFENGTQGEKRNDLIVVRYTKDATTGIEGTEMVVVKGTSTTGTAKDPVLTTGDILHENALINEFALYRVPFDGLVMQDLVCLFDTVPTWETLKDEVRKETKEAVKEMQETVVDNYEDVLATTEDNVAVGSKAFQTLSDRVDDASDEIEKLKKADTDEAAKRKAEDDKFHKMLNKSFKQITDCAYISNYGIKTYYPVYSSPLTDGETVRVPSEITYPDTLSMTDETVIARGLYKVTKPISFIDADGKTRYTATFTSLNAYTVGEQVAMLYDKLLGSLLLCNGSYEADKLTNVVLNADITKYWTIQFMCGSGDLHCLGMIRTQIATGIHYIIPVGNGYIKVQFPTTHSMILEENTTPYPLRYIRAWEA